MPKGPRRTGATPADEGGVGFQRGQKVLEFGTVKLAVGLTMVEIGRPPHDKH